MNRPALPESLLAQARQLLAQGRLADAAKAYGEVLQHQPACVEALVQLGRLLYHFKQDEAALAVLERALQLAPATPKLHLLTAAVLKRLGRLEAAAAACEREIRLSPADADARYNLGLVRQALKQPAAAVETFKQAVQLRPDYVDAWVALGMALRQAGEHETALGSFERVLQLAPQHAESHFEIATILLAQGRFERGWQEYEWRWKLKDPASVPSFQQPLWDGKDLGGRRILLHCEQGFGDTLQFCRYASLVADRHGEVILGCPEPLRPLMETLRGVTHVVTSRLNQPEFVTHAPLLSLPGILGTTLETIPQEVPYLHPPRQGPMPTWVKSSSALKVGLAWSGSAGNLTGRYRSLRLETLAPLLRLPGIDWYSLQVGPAAEELAAAFGRIENLGPRFHSFGDTAQAMCQLDLIISIDTAVAHLAGALGRPVWTLLPSEADWRWLTDRADSPWYPTMRLFRQAHPDDWPGVVERVAQALGELPSATGRFPAQFPG